MDERQFFYVLRPGGDDPPQYLIGWENDEPIFSEDLKDALRFKTSADAQKGKQGHAMIYEGLNKMRPWSRKENRD